MSIADRIQELRKKNGYSQEELAYKIGVSRQAISKWEREQSLPDLDNIIIMSDLFQVTTDYILKGVEQSSTQNERSIKDLYIGCILICSIITGIWSFTANRFNYHECLCIMIAGGLIGLGIALVIQILVNIINNK